MRYGKTPEVSVVLPFRNAAGTLWQAVESVRLQSLEAFECLLIDNGSTDASVAISREVCARDPRFRLLYASGGLVSALNAGLVAAQASLVARMDADDVAHPQRLERQLGLLANDPSVSIVSCRVACFSDEPLGEGMRHYLAWLNSLISPVQILNALFVESPLVHPSVLFPRDIVVNAGGYRDDGGPEDYDLWMRLLLSGYRAAKVPEILLYWRESAFRLTRVNERYHRRRFFETKLRYLPRVLPTDRAIQIWGAGPTGRRWARALQKCGYVIRGFIDVDPRKVGRSLHGTPIVAPTSLRTERCFVLAAVGSRSARDRIESHLVGQGLRPRNDYLLVA